MSPAGWGEPGHLSTATCPLPPRTGAPSCFGACTLSPPALCSQEGRQLEFWLVLRVEHVQCMGEADGGEGCAVLPSWALTSVSSLQGDQDDRSYKQGRPSSPSSTGSVSLGRCTPTSRSPQHYSGPGTHPCPPHPPPPAEAALLGGDLCPRNTALPAVHRGKPISLVTSRLGLPRARGSWLARRVKGPLGGAHTSEHLVGASVEGVSGGELAPTSPGWAGQLRTGSGLALSPMAWRDTGQEAPGSE